MRGSTCSGPSDDRGVSNVVGFIFVFSFLILTFTIYQGMIVPEQNRKAEFDHNQEVQTDMQDLRNAIQNAAGGTDQSATVALGANYPQRTLSQNLATASGTIQTREFDAGITVRNVTPTDGETSDYFNKSSPTIGPLATKSLQYRPNYVRYSSAPTTIYENSVIYNQFDGGTNLSLTGQALVDGRRITLVALNGSLSEASERSVTVDAEALSASTESIAVTNATGKKLNITIPSRLSAADWEDLLNDQMDTAGADERYVESVKNSGPGQISIILEKDVTYDLRLAKVGVGSNRTESDAHYVTDVSGNATSIAEGGTQKLVVEVRDRFNNPVSNVTVQSSIETSAGSGDFVSPGAAVTDAEGRASFTYTAPGDVDDTQNAEITLFFDEKTPGRQNATFAVDVLDADGSGGGACGDDPGTGGDEPWCSSEPTTTVSQPGGVISDIGSATAIEISDPSFSSIRPDNSQVRTASERFRLAFVLEKDQASLDGTKRFMFVVPNTNAGFNQDLDNSGTTVQNRGVKIYVDEQTNTDGFGWETHVSQDLQQGDLDSWYDGALVIDLLDSSHYAGNVQTELDEIQTFMSSNDVRIYIVDMDGRVDIKIN